MITISLLIIIAFSVLYLGMSALIDGYINVQCDVYRRYMITMTLVDAKKAQRAQQIWHLVSIVRNMIVGILFSVYISNSFIMVVKSFVVYYGVWLLIWDGIEMELRGLGWNYYGTNDFVGDVDVFWIILKDKFGINQTVAKSVIFIGCLLMWFMV